MKKTYTDHIDDDIAVLNIMASRSRLLAGRCKVHESHVDVLGHKATNIQIEHAATCNMARDEFLKAASLMSQAHAALVKANIEIMRGRVSKAQLNEVIPTL